MYKSVTITEEEEIRTVFERFGGTSQIVLVDENFLFFLGGGGGGAAIGGCVALISFGLKCYPSLAVIPYNEEATR